MKQFNNINNKLTLGWLYPDLMNIYGDRGNVIVLQKRCEWRGIDVEIRYIDQAADDQRLATCDLLLMGGAQDMQQEIVGKDLQKKKKTLSEMIEGGVPGLYICGGFQYLGQYYKTADGNKLPQLGVLDMYTENPGRERLIGNIAVEVRGLWDVARSEGQVSTPYTIPPTTYFVGFENHGGRTVLGKDIKPLGKVLYGYGSNDSRKEEGAIYKNTIGTYFHGPILPKNPELADWLIIRALERKYKKKFAILPHPNPLLEGEGTPFPEGEGGDEGKIILPLLDDSLALKARDVMLRKLLH